MSTLGPISTDLSAIAQSWSPVPVTVTRSITAGALAAFADVLDDGGSFPDGALVPLLWHWFAFSDGCPQAELGEDGHPRSGHFLPPISDRRRMMAGGRIEQRRPFVVGSTYERRSELIATRHKQGRSGEMLFTTIRHTFTQVGLEGTTATEPTALEDEHIVYRRQAGGAPRAKEEEISAHQGPSWAEHLGDHGRVHLASDPRLLFRFSALTYNTHRIHYDTPYAHDVEGYPGLVVHGPLLALTMLELPRRAGRVAAEFDYRLLAPVYSGSTILATWDGADLAVGSEGAHRPSARGTWSQ